MGPGGKDGSPCHENQRRHAVDGTLQSISATIFVFLFYGKFQACARVLKPLLDTLLCTRNRQALGYITKSKGNPDRMEPTF